MRRQLQSKGEEGSALVWALLFVIITAGMIISHATHLAANRREMELRYQYAAMANNFARSGLDDAVTWYRQQPTQPVTTFAPKLEPSADPPKLETLDPTIGLVREFEIRGNLWGRYEIRTAETLDISPERGMTMPGSVWDVGSRGFIYFLKDSSTPFDQPPNRLVATTFVRSEMRGIPLAPPAQSAVAVEDPWGILVGSNGVVSGGGNPGFAYPDDPSLGVPGSMGAGSVGGTPPTVAVPNYSSAAESVFSMRLDQLRALADLVIGPNSARPWRWQRSWHAPGKGQTAPLPLRKPRDLVIFVDGDLVLQRDEQLEGRMLIVVDGDFTAEAGNKSKIEGMIYVTGDVSIQGPFELDGALVARGQFAIGNGGSELATISYDGPALQVLRHAVAAYRHTQSIRPGWKTN